MGFEDLIPKPKPKVHVPEGTFPPTDPKNSDCVLKDLYDFVLEDLYDHIGIIGTEHTNKAIVKIIANMNAESPEVPGDQNYAKQGLLDYMNSLPLDERQLLIKKAKMLLGNER